MKSGAPFNAPLFLFFVPPWISVMFFFRLFRLSIVSFSASAGTLIILLSGWGLLGAGCFNPFAPELDEGQDLTNVITEQQSPEEVLQNFQIAYTFKDSLIYSDVLDESFVFEYFDPNLGPSGSFVTWGRDTDLKTTGRLFRTFDVIDLKFLNTIFSEREGELERRFIRFNLSLFGSEFNFIITGTAIFTFQQSEQDNKWRIVRWKDESDL